MSLQDKNVVVTGGSRGLGLGLVEALVAHGAKVTVVARDADALKSVRTRLRVATIAADVTDETAAHRILSQLRPDILVLNAGTPPPMGRLDRLSWADFTSTWETDVRGGLYWLQAALKAPLKPGSRVLVGSSGAAVKDREWASPAMLWNIRDKIKEVDDFITPDRAAADHWRGAPGVDFSEAQQSSSRSPQRNRRAGAINGSSCWTTRNMPRALSKSRNG